MNTREKQIELVFANISYYKYTKKLMPAIAENIKQKLTICTIREPYSQGSMYTTKDLIKNIELF